jgi:hypothetical protein
MKKELMQNLARDFIALGGIPFFAIVVVRIWLLDTPAYLTQFLIAGGLFLAITLILKNSIYSGLSLIALFFTALVYADLRYTIFGSIIYLLLLGSLFYLNYGKKKIIFGVILGAITTAIGYYAVELIF